MSVGFGFALNGIDKGTEMSNELNIFLNYAKQNLPYQNIKLTISTFKSYKMLRKDTELERA